MDLSSFSTPEIAVAMVFTGLVVVFCAVVGLWFIVALFGKAFEAFQNKPKPSAPAAPPAPKAAPPAAPAAKAPMKIKQGIGDETVAAIVAAITAMTGGKAVIRSVKRSREARSNWAQAGVVQNTQPF